MDRWQVGPQQALAARRRSHPATQPPGARQVFLREAKRTRLDPTSGGFVTDNEWVLDTEGGCRRQLHWAVCVDRQGTPQR